MSVATPRIYNNGLKPMGTEGQIAVYGAVNAQIIVSYRRDRPLDCPLAPITEHLGAVEDACPYGFY